MKTIEKGKDGKKVERVFRKLNLKKSEKMPFLTTNIANPTDLDTSKGECEDIDSFLMNSNRSHNSSISISQQIENAIKRNQPPSLSPPSYCDKIEDFVLDDSF